MMYIPEVYTFAQPNSGFAKNGTSHTPPITHIAAYLAPKAIEIKIGIIRHGRKYTSFALLRRLGK